MEVVNAIHEFFEETYWIDPQPEQMRLDRS